MLAFQLLLALLPTILIEMGVLLLLGERRRRVLLSSVGANVMTNVPLNLYLRLCSGTMTDVLVGEAVVVVVEAVWYYAFLRTWRQAFRYSLWCNVASFLIGVAFQLGYAFISSVP